MATPILPTGYVKSVTIGSANNPGKLTVLGKFFSGDPLGDYIEFDGATFTVNALLNADDIVAGTLTGRTIRTSDLGAATGRAVQIEGGTDKDVQFYYNGVLKGYIGGYTDDPDGESEYLRIYAASGRSLSFKDSKIVWDGDCIPEGDEDHDNGKPTRKWNNIYAQTFWQQTNTDGSRRVYNFAYVEKGLISEKVLKKAERKAKRLQNTNGFIKGLKLPFKLGTVLRWTARGLKESEKETDFAIAIADGNGLPIIIGAEPVRVIGKAKIGDYIVPSNKEGCARSIRGKKEALDFEIIGRCLENKKGDKEKLTKVMIKF
jgi:hypothetical protein